MHPHEVGVYECMPCTYHIWEFSECVHTYRTWGWVQSRHPYEVGMYELVRCTHHIWGFRFSECVHTYLPEGLDQSWHPYEVCVRKCAWWTYNFQGFSECVHTYHTWGFRSIKEPLWGVCVDKLTISGATALPLRSPFLNPPATKLIRNMWLPLEPAKNQKDAVTVMSRTYFHNVRNSAHFPTYKFPFPTHNLQSNLPYTKTPMERWGAGVEYHFQKNSWALRPVVNGT